VNFFRHSVFHYINIRGTRAFAINNFIGETMLQIGLVRRLVSGRGGWNV